MAETALVIALISLAVGTVALTFQILDRPRLRITNIRPAISGSRQHNAQQWTHDVTSIEVTVENRGSRPAIACEAVITFARMEALPLHPQTPESTVDTTTRAFSVEPKASRRLVAAWNYSPGGSIDGTKPSITLGAFLEKAVPATVTVSCGKQRIRSTLDAATAQDIFQEQQTQTYLRTT